MEVCLRWTVLHLGFRQDHAAAAVGKEKQLRFSQTVHKQSTVWSGSDPEFIVYDS